MSAMTDGELFWKISKGIKGIMPDGEKRMTEEERWNVVNYVRTLAKEKPMN
jgi:mono/diheme cytochrome c family protein